MGRSRTGPTGDICQMTLGLFSGFGEGNDRLCLSTLHSAKGREFAAVILFGIEERRVPRANPSPADVQAARRLFYVGFTRAEKEVHFIYNAGRPSRFVQEVRTRLEEQEDGETDS